MKAPTTNELMVFLGAFCIGLIIVALNEPRPEVIVRWPTPKNTGLVTYLDRASNCYNYSHQEVTCDHGSDRIPVQNGDEGMTSGSKTDNQPKKHTITLDDYFQ